jgi:hypothetical protein
MSRLNYIGQVFRHQDLGEEPAGVSSHKGGTQAGVRERWESACRRLSDEIKVRHCSAKTPESYTTWVGKMQYYKTTLTHQASSACQDGISQGSSCVAFNSNR